MNGENRNMITSAGYRDIKKKALFDILSLFFSDFLCACGSWLLQNQGRKKAAAERDFQDAFFWGGGEEFLMTLNLN